MPGDSSVRSRGTQRSYRHRYRHSLHFLRGVFEVSEAATATARKILGLREQHRQRVKHQTLLDYLFEQPLVSINMVQERLGCGFPTASKYIEQFVAVGILRETTGQSRNRRFRYDPYLTLFESPDFAPFTQDDDSAGDQERARQTG